jgi:NAD(P)H-quinone oxidoreductase subunit 4
MAYSSVSHMGFIIIGIGSITNIGLNGAILQILSHGFGVELLMYTVVSGYYNPYFVQLVGTPRRV